MPTSQRPTTAADTGAMPPQLANSTIHQPPADTTGAAATKEPSSAVGKEQCEQFQSFMSLVHSYVMSAITFADQKAGFLFATDSAFLGYLLSNGLLLRLKAPVSAWHLVQWASIASLLLLGASNVNGCSRRDATPRGKAYGTDLFQSNRKPQAQIGIRQRSSLLYRCIA